jgi:hypothetical protein
MQRKQRRLTVRKTDSLPISDVSTVPEYGELLEIPSNRFLFDSSEELNISKICSTKRLI